MTGQDIGDTAEYSCPEGLVVNGDSTRMCVEPGVWDGSEPACKGMCLFKDPFLFINGQKQNNIKRKIFSILELVTTNFDNVFLRTLDY